MGEVISLNIEELPKDLPVEDILENAKIHLKNVVILGYNKDDSEYFASSISNAAEVVWLLERCKKILLDMGDE